MPKRRRYPAALIGGIPLKRPRSPDLGQVYGDVHLNEVFLWNGKKWTVVTRLIALPWQTWTAILGSLHGGGAFRDVPPEEPMGVVAFVARVATRPERNP